MWKDEIVRDVRHIRDLQAKRFNYDIDRIIDDARKRQMHSGRRIVSFAKPNKAERAVRYGNAVKAV